MVLEKKWSAVELIWEFGNRAACLGRALTANRWLYLKQQSIHKENNFSTFSFLYRWLIKREPTKWDFQNYSFKVSGPAGAIVLSSFPFSFAFLEHDGMDRIPAAVLWSLTGRRVVRVLQRSQASSLATDTVDTRIPRLDYAAFDFMLENELLGFL